MPKRQRGRRSQAEQRYRKHRQRNALAEPGVHEFVLVLDQLKAGFNVPKIFRSAQAFGAAAVHLINIPPFDPAPAKGAFKYVPAVFHEDFAACHAELGQQGYAFFNFEPQAERALFEIDLPPKSAFVFGNEELGIRFDPQQFSNIQPLKIPQFAPIDSLNVSVAASIVMYEYVRQRYAD
ncbi:MAG: TrmH family RNA methyltransferase [Chromatiales bacterium]|jgi:tRNA G18 (ribose-2'-O)-methylase SpoU